MQAALNNPKWVAKGSFIELKNGIKYGEGYLRELQLNTGEFIRSEKRKGRKVSKETQSMYDEITSALEKYDKNPPVIDRKRFQEMAKKFKFKQEVSILSKRYTKFKPKFAFF